MRRATYEHLRGIARRHSRRPDEVDDLVQEALLEAVKAGRTDLDAGPELRWLGGVIRNKARFAARTAARRMRRDLAFQQLPARKPPEASDIKAILTGLPPALKAVAALALAGHDRREIAYLLRLPDTALRQRVRALKRLLGARGIATPEGSPGLSLDLFYGRIRDALLPGLLQQGGIFASHDPDGHLFIVRLSQSGRARQQQA
jgi:DNA-directed RNA polymerase specialized sigma24 family protein